MFNSNKFSSSAEIVVVFILESTFSSYQQIKNTNTHKNLSKRKSPRNLEELKKVVLKLFEAYL